MMETSIVAFLDKNINREINMWLDLSFEWKMCFLLAWEAFCKGCTPVGAIIIDKSNNVVAQNRNGDSTIFHRRISHAEINALSSISSFTDIDDLVLYTSLEPCVMCFSAIYVQKIKKLCYGTKDPHAGGTFLYKCNPYFSVRNMDIIQLQNDEYSFTNAVLLILHEMREREARDLTEYLNTWNEINISFVNTAKKICSNINQFTLNSDIEEVYNYIVSYNQ